MDPRIHIRIRTHTKMSWIRNTGFVSFMSDRTKQYVFLFVAELSVFPTRFLILTLS
jgi:hypothetical protein